MRIIRWKDPDPAASRKYHAKPVTIDGERFASQREATRCMGLRMMARAGLIHGLRRQVRIDLKGVGPDGRPLVVCRYVADFVYWRATPGPNVTYVTPIVEDAKGVRTETYDLKRRWFALQFGFWIVEV